MIRQFKHSLRLIHVLRTLSRHDALFPLEGMVDMPAPLVIARAIARISVFGGGKEDGSPGQRLARALESLGPGFIKLGQALATRPDLVTAPVAEALTKLQDKLAPFSYADAKTAVEEEFGRPLDALFSDFEEQPVAAASIAQVHFAKTVDGEEVAVKILRPGIEKAFARDIDAFFWLADLIEQTQPALRRLRPRAVIEQFSQTVAIEMDLRMEAAAASELASNMRGNPDYILPAVDWLRTGRRVLTTERIQGVNLGDRDAVIEAGHDPVVLSRIIVETFLHQALTYGFFHADMHQGNLFVDKKGRLAAVDFGITGRLDRASRIYLAQILYGFLEADYDGVAWLHFEAGYVPRRHHPGRFAQALRSIAEPIHGLPLSQISFARLLAQLFQVTKTFDMQTQPQLLLLQKTMMMVEGVALKLNPDINMWEVAEPILKNWMRENLGPEARLRDATENGLDLIYTLPEIVEGLARLSDSVTDKGIRLHPDSMKALAREQAQRRAVPSWAWFVIAAAVVIGLWLS